MLFKIYGRVANVWRLGFSTSEICFLSVTLFISLSCVNKLYIFCSGMHHFLGWQTKNSLFKECRGKKVLMLPPLLLLFFKLIASKSIIPVSNFWHYDCLNLLPTWRGTNITAPIFFPTFIQEQKTWENSKTHLRKCSDMHPRKNHHLVFQSWRKNMG